MTDMKRVLMILLIFIFTSSIFAASNVQTKRVAVQAGVGEVLYVSIVPIAAQSSSFVVGMPFSVDDSVVKYDYPRTGRQIASWSLLSNSDFEVAVHAPVLKNITNASSSTELPYYLCFTYELSYYKQGDLIPSIESSAFVIRSENNNDGESIPSAYGSFSDKVYNSTVTSNATDSEYLSLISDVSYSNRYVGTLDGGIYFKFASNADTDNADVGEYEATVEIMVRSKA